MQAATYRKYGPADVLTVEAVARPRPKDNEVLVRVRASSVTTGDTRIRGFRGAGIFWLPLRLMFGLRRPKHPIPGMEFAGRVEAVGAHVTSFEFGEDVFGMKLHGANAEYLAMPEDGVIAPKPNGLSDRDAAAVPFGALSALAFLRDVARVQAGTKVLVYGAAGNVGAFAVQLAKYYGAEVTGVCGPAGLDLVRSLGADKVIDYTTADFAEARDAYDLILDTVGVTSFARCKQALRPNGRHLFLSFGLRQLLQMLWTRLRPGKRVVCGFSRANGDDLMFVAKLIEAGRIRPVIDRTYRLREIAEAHRYVDTGRKKGSVVVVIEG